MATSVQDKDLCPDQTLARGLPFKDLWIKLRPFSLPRPVVRPGCAGLVLLAFALLALFSPTAQAKNLIRDAEIEYAMAKLARPVLSAAGLPAGRIKILIIEDSALNAFVMDSQHIFINSGLILKLKTPEQLQAVIAHEAAHIANGHISRRLSNIGTANTAAKLGLLLATAVIASGHGDAGAGIAVGAAASAHRVLLSHTRSEEASADQSGVRYLARAGIDPAAMVEVLNMFKDQEALSLGRRDPYALTHPLSRQRLRAVKGYAAAYKPRGKPDSQTAYWYARARGKLGAFIRHSKWGLHEAKATPYKDVATMMRAVAYHGKPDIKRALAEINRLIKMRPKDAYAHELKGQILLETRQSAAAVAAYGRAVALAPDQPLILAGYGRALLAQKNYGKALSVLRKARARDPFDARMMRDLALAYAKTGNNGMASLATAERYAMQGRLKDAGIHAKRAAGLLPRGSTGWNRAQDVLRAAENAKNKKRR
ncbi:MAG: peptidase M48 [Rhodobacterales bacterium]|nr:MAG: peptidase M48 [Rhodobacterales bacterium]